MSGPVGAQPDPFDGHDAGAWSPCPATTVATWPAGAFAENLAVDAEGSVLVTLHSHSRIDRYDPPTGRTSPYAHFPAPVAGIALDAAGTLWVTGGTPGQTPGIVWRMGPDKAPVEWCRIEDAVFLNGCTPACDGRTLLVCESMTGRILAVDQMTPGWRTWVADDRLRPADQQTPGANGIKLHGEMAYISVTGRNMVLRAALGQSGEPGPLEVAHDRLRADDFAFAASGALFVATHPAQSVLRISPDGQRTTIAGPEQGAVGSTACAFGRAPADRNALYVTTNGGLYAPWRGAIQDAKLLRLDVGEPGAGLLPDEAA